MEDSPRRSRRCSDDDHPFSVEALSQYSRVSPAFIRLCLELGCPAPEKRLSQSDLIEWLTLNYGAVRMTAGLAPLAPVFGVRPATRRKLQLADTMLTLLDYAESRSTRLEEKLRLRQVREHAERTL